MAEFKKNKSKVLHFLLHVYLRTEMKWNKNVTTGLNSINWPFTKALSLGFDPSYFFFLNNQPCKAFFSTCIF